MPSPLLDTVISLIGPSAKADISASKRQKAVAKNGSGKNFGKKSYIDFALQTRHIDSDSASKRTTIALEQAFWRQADNQAEKLGQPWQQWAAGILEDRPENIGKARWLRVKLLTTYQKGRIK